MEKAWAEEANDAYLRAGAAPQVTLIMASLDYFNRHSAPVPVIFGISRI
jgi:hypothetical protein